MRKKLYTLDSMKEEAAKAKAIGCEALYQDPGWDTTFASKIWDESRLGSYASFTAMLQRDYGLKSSLHTPLSGWCDPSSYPIEAHRLDRFGERATWDPAAGFSLPVLCGASQQYLTVTNQRLHDLAKNGATFFMFDGTAYHEECWDPNHGHQVPSRLEEHTQATSRLARMVHTDSPQVLIEMHDQAVGGAPMRACPIYYGYSHCPEGEQFCQALGFDTVWAFELMWKPMEDLTSGRSSLSTTTTSPIACRCTSTSTFAPTIRMLSSSGGTLPPAATSALAERIRTRQFATRRRKAWQTIVGLKRTMRPASSLASMNRPTFIPTRKARAPSSIASTSTSSLPNARFDLNRLVSGSLPAPTLSSLAPTSVAPATHTSDASVSPEEVTP